MPPPPVIPPKPSRIDTFFLRYQLEGVRESVRSLTSALEVVARVKKLLGKEPKGLAEMLLGVFVEGRNRDWIARAAYVYGWAAFRNLVASSARLVFLAHPQLLLGGVTEKKSMQLLCEAITSDWNRDSIIGELVDDEIRRLNLRALEDLPAYFHRRLSIDWPDGMVATLRPIAEARHKAAHDSYFRPPSIEQIDEHMQTLEAQGLAIARSVSERHGVPLREKPDDPT